MSMQMVELHYKNPPSFDPQAIVARAESFTQSGIESPARARRER